MARKGETMKILDDVLKLWNTHHTTRKAIEGAVYGAIATIAVAIINDPTVIEKANSSWYVAAGMIILGIITNWCKWNVKNLPIVGSKK